MTTLEKELTITDAENLAFLWSIGSMAKLASLKLGRGSSTVWTVLYPWSRRRSMSCSDARW